MTIVPHFGLMIDTHFPTVIRPIMRHSLVTLFQQSPHTAGTLRDRLCGALRQAIHQTALSVGQRLPSSRVLASDLGLSRVTVEAAYGQLEAEGYLQRRVGQGTFVAIIIAKSPPPATAAGIPRRSAANRSYKPAAAAIRSSHGRLPPARRICVRFRWPCGSN